jgi:hypothetical protein
MSKRTRQYHGSWIKFSYDNNPFIYPEQLEAALDKYCRNAFYMKSAKAFFMVQRQDATRLRLRSFLDLEPPAQQYTSYSMQNGTMVATPVPASAFPTRVHFQMEVKNTRAAEVAKIMRKRLRFRKVRSERNPHWNPNSNDPVNRHCGCIHMTYDRPIERNMIAYAMRDMINDGTLELFDDYAEKRLLFAVVK